MVRLQKHSVKSKEILRKAKSLKEFGVNLYKPLKREDLFKKLTNQEYFYTREHQTRLFVWLWQRLK